MRSNNILTESELSDNEHIRVFVAWFLDIDRKEKTAAIFANSFEDFYRKLLKHEGNVILLGYKEQTESEYKEAV